MSSGALRVSEVTADELDIVSERSADSESRL